MKNKVFLFFLTWSMMLLMDSCRVVKYPFPNRKVYTYSIEDNSILGKTYLNVKVNKLIRDKGDGMQWVEGTLYSEGFPIEKARINYGNANGDTTFMYFTGENGIFKLSIKQNDTVKFSKDGYHDLYMHFKKE